MNIVLFKGVRNLMLADKACKEAGLEVKVMPVPHQYSTECGMSLIIKDEDVDKFREIVTAIHIDIELLKKL